MLDTQKYDVVYRRWILAIPILMILIGMTIYLFLGADDPRIGLLGLLLAFIGVMTFFILFAVVLGTIFGARILEKQATTRSSTSFRERYEASEQKAKERKSDGN